MPGRGTPANPNGARTAKPSLRHDNRLSLTTHLPRCLLGRWPRKNLPARGIHTPRQPGFRWAEFGVAVLGFAPRPYGRFALYEVVRRRTNRLKQPVASDTRRNDSKRSEKTGDWATQAPLGTPASTGSKNLRSRHFETYASNPSCQMGTLEKMSQLAILRETGLSQRSFGPLAPCTFGPSRVTGRSHVSIRTTRRSAIERTLDRLCYRWSFLAADRDVAPKNHRWPVRTSSRRLGVYARPSFLTCSGVVSRHS